MYQEERMQHILKLLQQQKTLSNADLADTLEVSVDTVRRDISRLEEEGLAQRTHGGVMLPHSHFEALSYQKRIPVRLECKKEIAQYAAGYFLKSGLCFLDVSTTIEEMCEYATDTMTIYTHSFDNVDRLAGKGAAVHLLGGCLNESGRFFYGSETLQQVNQIYFDSVFFGTAALHNDGVYFEDSEDAAIKQLVAARAKHVYIVADSSKFYKQSKYKGVSYQDIDVLLTEKQPPAEIANCLAQAQVVIDTVKKEQDG